MATPVLTRAEPLGGARWRLSHFLRGRGGTEHAIASHGANEPFVLLDDRLTPLDPAIVLSPTAETILALGNDDPEPAVAALAYPHASLRPLSPVHGRIVRHADGSAELSWTRRSRGAWQWLADVEVPINEPDERYEVTFVDGGGNRTVWVVSQPSLSLTPSQVQTFESASEPRNFEIRQGGAKAVSFPLSLQFAT